MFPTLPSLHTRLAAAFIQTEAPKSPHSPSVTFAFGDDRWGAPKLPMGTVGGGGPKHSLILGTTDGISLWHHH